MMNTPQSAVMISWSSMRSYRNKRETGLRSFEKGEEMATQSRNPLSKFLRSLFGFPEGEPGSCACSGEPVAAEQAPREKPADRCCEKQNGPGISVQPTAGCCGG